MTKDSSFKLIQQYLILLHLDRLRQSRSIIKSNHQLNPEDAFTLALIRYHFVAFGHSNALKDLYDLNLIDKHHYLTKLGRIFIKQAMPRCASILLDQFVFHIVAILMALLLDASLGLLSWLSCHESFRIARVHIGIYGGSPTSVWPLIDIGVFLLGIFLGIACFIVALATIVIIFDPHAIPHPVGTEHATKLDFIDLAVQHPKALDIKLNISLSHILAKAFNPKVTTI